MYFYERIVRLSTCTRQNNLELCLRLHKQFENFSALHWSTTNLGSSGIYQCFSSVCTLISAYPVLAL